MIKNGSVEVFRVSARRRLGYPGALMVLFLAALVKWHFQADPALPKVCILLLLVSFLLYLYLYLIRLTIGPEGISLSWTLQGEVTLKWDAITQIRRSEAQAAGHFFIDLIASPELSIQFNPFFFDKPEEIVEMLNRYLDSDLFQEDVFKAESVPGEIAIAAESQPAPSNLRLLMALAGLVVIAFLLYLHYGKS